MSSKFIMIVGLISYFAIAACHSPLMRGWPVDLFLILFYVLLGLCHAYVVTQEHNSKGPDDRHLPPMIPVGA
jgi:hypothetical protein